MSGNYLFNGLTMLRFLRECEHGGLDEKRCWEWKGSTNSNGYGRFPLQNDLVLAHRLSYEMFVARISPGMNVLHSCDNRMCVNPMHLWEGTQSDNLKDASRKDRMFRPNTNGSRNGNSSLTDEKVAAIRLMASKKVLKKHLAAQFGVSQSTIGDIVHGRTWRHCLGDR